MNNQRIEFRIGLMVIMALVMLVVLTIQFGRQSFFNFGREYKLRVRFDSAPGLVSKVSVFKNGVKIGRVASVQLVNDDQEVEALLMIQGNRKLYSNEECRLKQPPLMGDATIEFVRKKTPADEETRQLAENDLLNGVVPADIFNAFSNIEGELTSAISNVSSAALNLGEFIQSISLFVGTPEEIVEKQKSLEVIFEQFNTTMKSITTLSGNINDIVTDPAVNENIRKATCKFPETIDKTNLLLGEMHGFINRTSESLGKVDRAFVKVEATLDKIDGAVNDVKPLTEALGTQGPEITASLRESARKLDSMFDELTKLVQSINNADGSIKRLINDTELYDNLQETIGNAKELTADLKPLLREAKPIADNVKVFTDKIAREPSAIISGLIRKKPPLKGALPQWGDGLGSDGLCESDLSMMRDQSMLLCAGGGLAGRNNPMLEMESKSLFWWPFGKKRETSGNEFQEESVAARCKTCGLRHAASHPHHGGIHEGEGYYETEGFHEGVPTLAPPMQEPILDFTPAEPGRETETIQPAPNLSRNVDRGRVVVTDPRIRRQGHQAQAMVQGNIRQVGYQTQGDLPEMVFTPEKIR